MHIVDDATDQAGASSAGKRRSGLWPRYCRAGLSNTAYSGAVPGLEERLSTARQCAGEYPGRGVTDAVWPHVRRVGDQDHSGPFTAGQGAIDIPQYRVPVRNIHWYQFSTKRDISNVVKIGDISNVVQESPFFVLVCFSRRF